MKIISSFFLVIIGLQVSGQEKRKLNLDSLANRNLRFIPLPSLIVSPETGLKGGFFVDYFYTTNEKKDSTTRPSQSWVQVLYSTRKQFLAEAFTSTYTAKEKYYVGFRGGFIDNYERYWGLSYPNVGNQDYQEVTYNRIFCNGRVSKNLGHKVFTGIGFYYSDYNNLVFAGKSGEKANLPNTETFGVGLVLGIDRRDNQFSPSKGVYFDISNIVNYNMLTKSFAFNAFNIDARKYNEWGKHIVANQFLLTNLEGDVPILEKARFGGSNMMRGVFQGRYRDNNMWVLQSEYRYALSRLLKVAYFASAGSTATTLNHLLHETIHVSNGVGLRLLLNKSKKIYLRADAAIATNGQVGYYLKVSDAY